MQPHLNQRVINKLIRRIEMKVEQLQAFKILLTSKVERLQRIINDRIARAIAMDRIPTDQLESFTQYFYDKMVDFR